MHNSRGMGHINPHLPLVQPFMRIELRVRLFVPNLRSHSLHRIVSVKTAICRPDRLASLDCGKPSRKSLFFENRSGAYLWAVAAHA